MTVFVVTIDGIVQEYAHTGLLNVCERYGIPYYQAYRGRKEFTIEGKVFVIASVSIHKNTRGRKF